MKDLPLGRGVTSWSEIFPWREGVHQRPATEPDLSKYAILGMTNGRICFLEELGDVPHGTKFPQRIATRDYLNCDLWRCREFEPFGVDPCGFFPPLAKTATVSLREALEWVRADPLNQAPEPA
jgi:hypothetical protein